MKLMTRRGALVAVVATLAVALPVVGVAPAAGASDAAAKQPSVIHVPGDQPTIQQAVNAAKPGTLVLIKAGVYHEGITVKAKNHDIVIRGESRAGTIIDGKFDASTKFSNGFYVLADGVAIENMTARNYVNNGFFWYGVDGYRGSFLTAIRNGDYGIYSKGAAHGQFDHDYASGSPDAGFYIGQCQPCHAVITDSEAEWNGLGYSGTNAGGDLVIARSSFHDNHGGIVPNSETGEKLYPQRGATFVGNTVHDNNNVQASAIEIAELATGTGILVAGGEDNVVERNLVYAQTVVGIGVVPLPEKLIDPANPKSRNFDPSGDTVRDNALHGNFLDLLLVGSITDAKRSGSSCFSGNHPASSLPAGLELLLPCDGASTGTFSADIPTFLKLLGSKKPPVPDFKTVPLPDPSSLPDMPKASTAKPRTARRVPMHVNVAKVELPTG